MCNFVSFDTNKAFRYLIKNAANSDDMRALHEQYSLWRENEPGRYMQKPVQSELQRFFSPGIENAKLPALLKGAGGPRLAQLKWGFIPNWRSDRPKDDPLKAVDRARKALDIGRKTWNAASETMFEDEKPTWRDSAHDRRCVILLEGFFVMHYQDDETYPIYITLKDFEPLPVAGLWDVATINDKEYLTCAIVTQEANEKIHEINNGGERPHTMPIILNPENFDQWLEPIDQGDYDKIDKISELITAPSNRELEYISVVKNSEGSVDNSQLAQDFFEYKELKLDLKGL